MYVTLSPIIPSATAAQDRSSIAEHGDESIAVATYGTALSTILNFYYPRYDFECFKKIVNFMPFVIRLDFEGEMLVGHQTELIIHKEYMN